MPGGIETLPSSVLQEILNSRLGAVDLARLESCSSMFRAASGIAPCESKSITEAAAHHSCQTHPVFANLPARARLALLARCDGHWKQVLYFLECLLRMRGHSTPAGGCSNVVATAGMDHTLIVNGNGELYITSGKDELSDVYCNIPLESQSSLRLILSQPSTNRILQISANWYHAAFVTETGQVFTFGLNRHWCCGAGLYNDQKISKPALVTTLEMTPCQQVTTGLDFTVALTRSGVLYSWGKNDYGQLGHGHQSTYESRPREVLVQSNNGAPDTVVQVSTTLDHVVAVTEAGHLFTWGSGSWGCLGHDGSWNELRPKRVEHGGFMFYELFIVCAAAGHQCSAAIDSSGLVYTWGRCYLGYSWSPRLVVSLKAYRAVQVVTNSSLVVVLDDGRVHHFGNGKLSGSFAIKGHQIQSIASGYDHEVMVTTRGAMFGFGRNGARQLGVVDPSALSRDSVSMPTEVFTAVTKSDRAAEIQRSYPTA